MVAIFTYHNNQEKWPESQAIAYSTDKGRTWKKHTVNPVLKNPGITDFRDPKVFWDDKTGSWLMALAAGDVIQFYSSPDLLNWTLMSDFGRGRGNHIGPWECPDLFPVKVAGSNEIKWVLLVSVVDLTQGIDRLATATQYFIGDFDGRQFTSTKQDTLWLDHGKDNYAGNTFNNVPDKRRIFTGWMQSHQYGGAVQQLITKTWAGAATFPREITITKTGNIYRLRQNPVTELASLYGNALKLRHIKVNDTYPLLSKVNAEKAPLDIQLEFNNSHPPEQYGLRLKNSNGEYIEMIYDSKAGQFIVDRTKATSAKIHNRYASIQKISYKSAGNSMHWRLLIDVASVELFAADGEVVFTNTVYPSIPFDQLELFSKNGPIELKKGMVYQLKSGE